MQHVNKFFSFLSRVYGPVTPQQMLERQLEQAKIARVQAAAKVEEWTAELNLQQTKIARINNELEN